MPGLPMMNLCISSAGTSSKEEARRMAVDEFRTFNVRIGHIALALGYGYSIGQRHFFTTAHY